jgi:hypothetical protein
MTHLCRRLAVSAIAKCEVLSYRDLNPKPYEAAAGLSPLAHAVETLIIRYDEIGEYLHSAIPGRQRQWSPIISRQDVLVFKSVNLSALGGG